MSGDGTNDRNGADGADGDDEHRQSWGDKIRREQPWLDPVLDVLSFVLN
ncbi:hypothetical protein [Halobaculum litoreum]|uniref:Uncharacterized protein n=1 Tax=Halobaculum litoreum TaxID=3031998 RepID=A0ABD5XT95_9EURY|nr:hypothetical protein [Halobaculum sp. DT92]